MGLTTISGKLELYSRPLVTVFVGPEKHEFKLPKNLICYNSKYFDRAFNGPFKEAEEHTLHLVDCDKEEFERVVQWMLTYNVHFDPGSFFQVKETISTMVAFLKLADRLDVLGPFDSVIDKIRRLLVEDTNVSQLSMFKALSSCLRVIHFELCLARFVPRTTYTISL